MMNELLVAVMLVNPCCCFTKPVVRRTPVHATVAATPVKRDTLVIHTETIRTVKEKRSWMSKHAWLVGGVAGVVLTAILLHDKKDSTNAPAPARDGDGDDDNDHHGRD